MPRLDLQYRNRDIAGMLRSLRDQARKLEDQLMWLQTRTEMAPQDEIFSDVEVRDQLTNVSLAADNLSGEANLVWKRTR